MTPTSHFDLNGAITIEFSHALNLREIYKHAIGELMAFLISACYYAWIVL